MKHLCGFFMLLSCVIYTQALSYSNVKTDIFPTKEVCGIQKDTEAGQFPWVAFIPVESHIYNPTANIRCTGTLINKRYVIVNKSCLQFVMTKVHLGQYDTTKDENVLKIDIEERVVDEKFDIVLLRLSKEVDYTDNIRPICLPFSNFQQPETGSTVFTSGYGLTSYEGTFSNIRKNVETTLTTDEECEKSTTLPKISKNSLCVKVKDSKSVPPCNGDEGGAVMYKDSDNWIIQGVLIGLFGSGNKPCVIEEPAIAFKITEEVLQWMNDKMRG